MTATRQPAVAGLFYPAREDQLRAAIRDFLEPHPAQEVAANRPKAIIAPHAGLVYSGAIAGSAWRRLVPWRGSFESAVLMGPAHHVPLSGLAVPSVDAFDTPLGAVAVDREAVDSLLELPFVEVSDEAHAPEHCLEVQLPFLIEALDTVEVVPVLVGRAAAETVAAALDQVWDGPERLIVVSSDLSHYQPSPVARELDAATSEAIVNLEAERVRETGACGWRAIGGLLQAARSHGLECTSLDLRNSGDTAGGRNAVVGYGAFMFTER